MKSVFQSARSTNGTGTESQSEIMNIKRKRMCMKKNLAIRENHMKMKIHTTVRH